MVDWFIAIQAILETILIIIFIVQSYQNQKQPDLNQFNPEA